MTESSANRSSVALTHHVYFVESGAIFATLKRLTVTVEHLKVYRDRQTENCAGTVMDRKLTTRPGLKGSNSGAEAILINRIFHLYLVIQNYSLLLILLLRITYATLAKCYHDREKKLT